MCDIKALEKMAAKIRKEIFITTFKGGGGHIGGAMSAVDILTVLYFGGILKYSSEFPKKHDRDRFILSKGHASVLLYTVLCEAGFVSREELHTYGKCGAKLGGHPKINDIPGIEATTGALGHGICFATGIALAGKIDGLKYDTYVLLGDGECEEGSVWEAALFAAQQKLGHLTAIVDYNKLQAMDKLDNIIKMEPLADKWKSFGWKVSEVDGHDIEKLYSVLSGKKEDCEIPHVVIAHTTKGKGVSFMENMPLWHYRLPNKEELPIAMAELNISDRELF